MPLKVTNYGEWEGDRQGYHPPACTCYSCNEAKRDGREIRPAPQTVSVPAAIPAAMPQAQRQPNKPAGTRPARRPFRAMGRSIGAALRYAIALHAAAIAGLAIYAVVQDGAEGIVPALSTAWDAYVEAWAAVAQAVRG